MGRYDGMALPESLSNRRVSDRERQAMPLDQFPPDHRARIAAEVAELWPPERWMPMGPGPRPIAWIESRAWYEWHWQRGINPGSSRSPIKLSIRMAVIERDGYVCGICEGEVAPDDVHLDHIFPYSRGGEDSFENLRVTHSLCNIRKGAKV